MKSRVYLETTVVSYLTALPAIDIIQAAHQQITREWWKHRDRFELFVSQLVIREAAHGNPNAASRRLAALAGVPVLSVGAEATWLAEELVGRRIVPARAAVDAVHIALAVVHGMDYLLTWNCAHIANAAIRAKIEYTCRAMGLEAPVICTPEELMEQ